MIHLPTTSTGHFPEFSWAATFGAFSEHAPPRLLPALPSPTLGAACWTFGFGRCPTTAIAKPSGLALAIGSGLVDRFAAGPVNTLIGVPASVAQHPAVTQSGTTGAEPHCGTDDLWCSSGVFPPTQLVLVMLLTDIPTCSARAGTAITDAGGTAPGSHSTPSSHPLSDTAVTPESAGGSIGSTSTLTRQSIPGFHAALL